MKTCYFENGKTSTFKCQSSPQSGKKDVPYRKDEIDVFVAYSKEQNEIYWIPFSEAGNRTMKLRHSEPKNGQTKNINWSADYKL